MKVTAFVGSASKKYTYLATEKFLQKLQSLGEIEYEIVQLNKYAIGTCKGCKLCLDKGEEFCPLKDDRDLLLEKMISSDGVIFATPNYSFQVSALLKIYLDRLGFCFHRPRFFGKTYTSIVVQGIYGGKAIVKYLNFIGKSLGFNVIKGVTFTTREPMSGKRWQIMEKTIERKSKQFYLKMIKKEYPVPSVFDLMVFRMSRTGMKANLHENYRDYCYYRDKGWFTSDFYYSVKLHPLKKLTGKLFDMLALKTM